MIYAEGEIFKDTLKGISLSSLLCMASLFIPIIGFLFAMFVPLPVMFYGSKLGTRSGLIIFGTTIFVLLCVLRSVSLYVVFFGELLFLGFLFSEFFRINLSVDKTIGYTCCAILATGAISLIIFGNIHATGIYSIISDYVAINLKSSIEIYKQLGMPEENIRMFSDNLEHIQYVFIRIIPSLLIASTLFLCWTTLLIAKPLFAKKKLFYPYFGTLNLWKAPEHLVWLVIASFLMIIIAGKAFGILGVNVLIAMAPIYFFQGMAIVSFYFDKKQLPKGARILLYSIIALQYIAAVFITVLGFFDVWLNVRKIQSSQKN